MVDECDYCEGSEAYEDETVWEVPTDLEKAIDKALEDAGIDAAIERGSVTKYGCAECGAEFQRGEAIVMFSRVTKEGDKEKRII